MDNRLKIGESGKIDKYLDLTRELKTMVTLTPIIVGALKTIQNCLEKRLEEMENRDRDQDHPDPSIEYIGKNTPESTGDRMSLKKPPTNAGGKNSQVVK